MFPYHGPPHKIMKFMLFHHKMNKEGYKDQWKNIHPQAQTWRPDLGLGDALRAKMANLRLECEIELSNYLKFLYLIPHHFHRIRELYSPLSTYQKLLTLRWVPQYFTSPKLTLQYLLIHIVSFDPFRLGGGGQKPYSRRVPKNMSVKIRAHNCAHEA